MFKLAFFVPPSHVEQVEEWRVELVVEDARVGPVVAALKASHPYQTPAYEVWQLADF